jgi:hypothetical protein
MHKNNRWRRVAKRVAEWLLRYSRGILHKREMTVTNKDEMMT